MRDYFDLWEFNFKFFLLAEIIGSCFDRGEFPMWLVYDSWFIIIRHKLMIAKRYNIIFKATLIEESHLRGCMMQASIIHALFYLMRFGYEIHSIITSVIVYMKSNWSEKLDHPKAIYLQQFSAMAPSVPSLLQFGWVTHSLRCKWQITSWCLRIKM